MEYSAVIYEKKNGYAVITLNQPKSLNALVKQLTDDLLNVTREIEADDEVKAVILTGAGKAFCAGGDLNRFVEGFDPVSAVEYVDALHPLTMEWIRLKKPTIAAVNGPAVGAGLSIALACDIIYASDQAKLGSAFINMGLIPDLACAYFLPRVIGPNKAKELLFTGRNVDAAEALSIGLVNCVLPHDELMSEAEKLAAQLAGGPTFAIWNTKRIVGMGLDMDLSNLLELESLIQGMCLTSKDSGEAVDAFLNKRKANFIGR